MRKKIIAGNWKMNKTGAQAAEFARALKSRIGSISRTEIIICPPYTALSSLVEIFKRTRVGVGAQNVFWEASGAYTGEISAEMLVDAGCSSAIIGHSERRQYFDETNQTVNARVKRTLTTTLTPIVCVGETLDQRKQGRTNDVVGNQIREGLADLTHEHIQKIILAYEPVWAIGTGVTATPEQAEEVHAFIRNLVKDMFTAKIGDEIHILYGGSAKPSNIHDLLSRKNIDGGLIGGASLEVESFAEMIRIAETLA